MATTKGTSGKRAASTSVYVATRSFNEFDEGQTYEMRASDAQPFVDLDYLRPADDEQVARFGGGDAGTVDNEGTASPAGSGQSTGS
jgi:hypothetical protein